MIYLIHKYSNIKDVKKYSHDIDTTLELDKAINKLKKHKVLALDTETNSLNVRKCKLLMLQIGEIEGDQYVFDMRTFSALELKDLLEDKTITFVGHNIKFDYNVLKNQGVLLHKVYDTMIAEQVIYNGKYSIPFLRKEKRLSLAGTYKHYFNVSIDKETRQQFHTVNKTQFTEQQIKYGSFDVIFPLEIKLKQEKLIEKLKLNKTIDLENKAVLALGDIEYNGFHIDTDKWLKISDIYKRKLIETTNKLDECLIKQDYKKVSKYFRTVFQKDLFDSSFENRRKTIVNWNSDKQVYEILTNVFNIFPVDKYNKPSSGAKAIELLPEKYDITTLLLQLRQESKIISSFGKEFIKQFLSDKNRIHTQFNQIVETGRISSRKPNLQQIPKTKEFREAFTAPEGKAIITADYSAQEARIIADKAKDEHYIDFFHNGDGDIHSFVATKMFTAAKGKEFKVSKTVHPEYRQKGKTINFAISFGGSAFSLSKTLKIPVEEAQELIDSFFKGFPKVKKMFDKNKQFALKNGYIRTNSVTNRIRYFRYWDELNKITSNMYLSTEDRKQIGKLKGSIERRALNTPVQGTASDMTKQALVLIREQLLKNNIKPFDNAPIKLVNVIHDEIAAESDIDKQQQASDILKQGMEDAGKKFIKSIPMTAVPVIKQYWDH